MLQVTMYRARAVVNNLVPFIPNVAGKERFASWLFSSSRNFSSSRVRPYSNQVAAEPFLNGSSSNYVEEMYNAWLEDPKSVHRVSGKFLSQFLLLSVMVVQLHATR